MAVGGCVGVGVLKVAWEDCWWVCDEVEEEFGGGEERRR